MKSATDYEAFIEGKRLRAPATGFDSVPALSPLLFPFQRDIVQWALRRGRAALWADCGLGKSWVALEWARVVAEHDEDDRPALILTPLAVAQQFVGEGAKMGIDVTHTRDQSGIKSGVNVTNYERLHKFDPSKFGAVVLDESSILKDYTSSTRNAVIEAFESCPFRLAQSATPAPNDHMELGNHAEFLGVMSRTEMLSMFFVHDGGSTQDWRLKGHAVREFWRWVCSWAVAIRAPSDLGYSDDGFILPPLALTERVVSVGTDFARSQGTLFAVEARGLSEQRDARKSSLGDRVKVAAEIVNAEPTEPWLIWCDLNAESEALTAAIPGAVELTGSMDNDLKEEIIGRVLYGCICDRKQNGKSPGIETTGSGDTPRIQNSGKRRSDLHPELRMKTGPTCENTTEPTGTSGPCEPRNRGTHTTQPGEPNTPQILSTEGGSRSKRKSRATRNENADSGAHLGSPPATTTECSPSKTGSARSVDGLSKEIYPSTIATEPVASAVSSAQGVTSESGSSTTTRESSSARRCTCGGPIRVLVSKPSICGQGINAQHCARVVFVGLSHSFEAWYQAIRRVYRFGQKREVKCWMISSDAEGAVVANLKRKQADAARMVSGMVAEMAEFANVKAATRDMTEYNPAKKMTIPKWVGAEDR